MNFCLSYEKTGVDLEAVFLDNFAGFLVSFPDDDDYFDYFQQEQRSDFRQLR